MGGPSAVNACAPKIREVLAPRTPLPHRSRSSVGSTAVADRPHRWKRERTCHSFARARSGREAGRSSQARACCFRARCGMSPAPSIAGTGRHGRSARPRPSESERVERPTTTGDQRARSWSFALVRRSSLSGRLIQPGFPSGIRAIPPRVIRISCSAHPADSAAIPKLGLGGYPRRHLALAIPSHAHHA
jgi:hypothetical protein